MYSVLPWGVINDSYDGYDDGNGDCVADNFNTDTLRSFQVLIHNASIAVIKRG